MGVPTSEVGYTLAMPGMVDHEVHKGHLRHTATCWPQKDTTRLCVCLFLPARACVLVCVCSRVCSCARVCVFVCSCVCSYACACVRVRVCTCVRLRVCVIWGFHRTVNLIFAILGCACRLVVSSQVAVKCIQTQLVIFILLRGVST